MGAEIGLVGLGQLGRRYLQGLLQTSCELSVWAVDSNTEALKMARDVVSVHGIGRTVEFAASVIDLPDDLDIVIGATSADARVATLQQLLEGRDVRSIILEKVLTQSLSESVELMRLASCVRDVWVNYPRRIMQWHSAIRPYVMQSAPVQVSVVGNSWGLMTNGLHFIDLVEWWIGNVAQDIKVPESLNWYDSKRPGFMDATGVVEVAFADGSTLTLQSGPEGQERGKSVIRLLSGGNSLTMCERDGLAAGSILPGPLPGKLDLQSEITGPLVDEILRTGTCRLPALREVLATHDLFISSVLAQGAVPGDVHGRLMIT